MDLLEIGQKFAEFRNQQDFDGAASLLHERCVYVVGNKATIGRTKIRPMLKHGPPLTATIDAIQNGVRIRSQMRNELLIIEDGLIVKMEVF